MFLTDDDLRRIIARAATLEERLAAPRRAATNRARAAQQLASWLRYYAGDDHAAFERRLAWDGLDLPHVFAALGADTAPREIPAEALLLRRLTSECSAVADELANGALPERSWCDVNELPPFPEVWIAFVRVASRALDEVAPHSRWSREARRALDLALLRDLSSLGAQVLYARFDANRSVGYDAFVRDLLTVSFRDLLLEYSWLARTAVTFVLDWLAASHELLSRLQNDRHDLEAIFGALGDVAALTPRLSERHENGRSVTSIEFASGVRLVYKPRPQHLFDFFQETLTLLEAADVPIPPRIRTLSRESYGWVEFVGQSGLREAADASRYYERAGALLATAWLLGARDLHMDNIIATADGPVAIDLEALLQPESHDAAADATFGKASQQITSSALATSLLNFPMVDPDGKVYEAGGFTGRGGHLSSRELTIWRDKGTDAIRPEKITRYADAEKNVLRVGDDVIAPEQYADALLHGFDVTYRALWSKREEITRSAEALRSRTTRVIFRPSNIYANLTARLLAPAMMRAGVAPSTLCDAINRVFVRDENRPRLWPLTRDERRQLLRFDIPIFFAPLGSRGITSMTESVDDAFALSGLEALARRAAMMSDENLSAQIELLSAALSQRSGHARSERNVAISGAMRPLSSDELISRATAIGDEVWSRAVRGADGAATWIGSAQLRMDGRQDRGASYYLYDGSSGVALFFAALSQLTGDDAWLERAGAALRPIELVLASGQASLLLQHEGIGAGNGLGSLIYALTTVDRITRRHDFAQSIRALASFMTPERIRADRRLDVEGGAAGAILALLHANGDGFVHQATECGEHLLASAAPTESGGRAWPNADGALLAGFAHGASGVAFALGELWRATGDARFQQAAGDAQIYESTIYSAAAQNWPILEKGLAGRDVFMNAWCHGAPGVALARLGLLETARTANTLADLIHAVETTIRGGIGDIDHLCCGNFGRIDILLTIAQRLKRDDLLLIAQQGTAAALQQADRRGRLALGNTSSSHFEAGFFRGVSGIGYTLLRLADPARLPSILDFSSTVHEARALELTEIQ